MESKYDLPDLVEALLGCMTELGYSKRELRDYRRLLAALAQYMHEAGVVHYTPTIGTQFLEHKRQGHEYAQEYWRWVCRAIRRLDAYADSGSPALSYTRIERICPPQFSQAFDDYLTYLKLIGYRKSTVTFHRASCFKVLPMLDAMGLKELRSLKAEDVYEVFEQSQDKHNLCSPLRSFLRYLFKEKITSADLSLLVPFVRKGKPVPSVYTKVETNALLASFDRSTAQGKRNYAITLLALRLGIRAGDIANLKISDVNFANKTVSFRQGKTGVFQALPLLPEIEEAIKTYLEYGRPEMNTDNLFVAVSPPMRPISSSTIGSMMQRQFALAGVTAASRRVGTHALRMTLASELVADRVPYNVVRKILGHENPTATKHYVQFDLESLRGCALATPPLQGEIQNRICPAGGTL